jgi:hypothetical protein
MRQKHYHYNADSFCYTASQHLKSLAFRNTLLSLRTSVYSCVSSDLLKARIFPSSSAAIQRQRSTTPSTGEMLYFELASISLNKPLMIVAAVRYRSKLTSGSLLGIVCEVVDIETYGSELVTQR